MSGFDEAPAEYEEIINRGLARFGECADQFAAHKATVIARFWRTAMLPVAGTFLDLGCGVGGLRPHVLEELPQLDYFGIDPSPGAIREARARAGVGFADRLTTYDGKSLPAPDGTFDMVFAANVLHHVPPPDRAALYREMLRVVRPGGYLMIFEHNPWNPLTQWLVRTCPLDEDAHLLRLGEIARALTDIGFSVKERAYVVFLPSRLRRALPWVEEALSWCPAGAQYWLVGRR